MYFGYGIRRSKLVGLKHDKDQYLDIPGTSVEDPETPKKSEEDVEAQQIDPPEPEDTPESPKSGRSTPGAEKEKEKEDEKEDEKKPILSRSKTLQ